MRTSEARQVRALVGWSAALVGALLLTFAIPMTTSAFTATITNSANSAVSKSVFTCADLFAGDARRKSAFFEYTLREDAGAATAVDSGLRGNTGTYQGANTKDTTSPRPCPADPGAPYALDGSSSRIISSTLLPPIRQDFSIEIWFKTPMGTGSEKLIGFEGTRGDASDNYDKHLYIDDQGHLEYGVYDGNTRTLVSSGRVNDGAWHQAVATTSGADGSKLYVDGVLDATDAAKVLAEGFSGYWRIGQGKLQQWPGAPNYSYFTGSLSFAAAYGEVLSAGEIRASFDIGKPGPVPVATVSAVPDDTATATTVSESPSASASASSSPSTSTPQAGAGGAKASSAPAASDISTTPGGAPPSS